MVSTIKFVLLGWEGAKKLVGLSLNWLELKA